MKKISIGFIALIALILFAGCDSQETNTVAVQKVSSIMGDTGETASERFAGVVTSESDIKVEKDSSYEVEEVLVSVGDVVTKGQALFRYNTSKLSISLEKAQLELEQLNNTLASLNSSLNQLQADKQKASSEEQLNYDIEIRDVESQIVEANYNISTKNAEIAKLQNSLNVATVTAPVAGRIKSINKDSNDSSQAYMVITQTSTYSIQGYINEGNLSLLPVQSKVIIRARNGSDIWTGTVSKIDKENPVTGTDSTASLDSTVSSKYPFYVTPDTVDNMILGQHVYIEQDIGQTSVAVSDDPVIPASYIVSADGASYVWAEDAAGKLEKVTVTLGVYDEVMGTYSITDGITKDSFIAIPSEDLKEGMPCREFDEDTANEYSEDEYSDDEYSDDEYSDDEYSDDEYSDDGYMEDAVG